MVPPIFCGDSDAIYYTTKPPTHFKIYRAKELPSAL